MADSARLSPTAGGGAGGSSLICNGGMKMLGRRVEERERFGALHIVLTVTGSFFFELEVDVGASYFAFFLA